MEGLLGRRAPLGKGWRDKVRAGSSDAGALGLLEELWVLGDLKAGLGCLSSDYILQWPWLLISSTFWATQQGAKQHEQTPLDWKEGSAEVDMHRDCSRVQCGAYVWGGHSWLPQNSGGTLVILNSREGRQGDRDERLGG